MRTFTSGSTVCCAWCGKHLGGATRVTYLNGNQPVCDLCLGRNPKKETACHPTFWPLPPTGTTCEMVEKLLSNAEDLPPEYSKIVDDHFWDLV